MFDEIRFPTQIGYGATGGPGFRTTIVETESGAEQRIGHWGRGKLKWNVGSGIKSREQLSELITFFRARRGRLRGFRFKDWIDYQATNEPLVINPNDDTAQLTKYYDDGVSAEIRKIVKPVASTIVVRVGGSVFHDWTINSATGVITFSYHPGTGVSWSGEFDVPVRFDIDEMRVTHEDFDITSWGDIPIVELLY